MNFELPEEVQMLQELVEKFVQNELMPLEARVLEREARGVRPLLRPEESEALHVRCREIGLFGLDVAEELGGAALGPVAKMAIGEELRRTIVPFVFPPDSPNLHMLLATANAEQRERYLEPYARGETTSAIAISEPGAGSDPASMTTRAERRGDDWVLNGRKIWVSRIADADFSIVMALTDPEKKARGGITAFLVDRDTPGMKISEPYLMLGGHSTYEVVFEDCRLPASQVLGEIGAGFAPMQLRLTVRRLEMGATCVGIARRALDLMIEQANQRSTFGAKLADRQAVQWWIADAATKIHATRLMVRDAAWKTEQGQDVRTEASMIKVFATEMATEVVDHAMQSYGAMGITKEMPLQMAAQQVRAARVYEGPTEVHRWVIARRLLRDGHAGAG